MLTEELRKACLKNDRKAHFELYKVLFPFMMSTAKRYATDEADAEDLFHRAFLKILDNLNKIPTNVAFEAWCRRILINLAIDAFRKKQIENSWLTFTDTINDTTPIEVFELENYDMATLSLLLTKLPPASKKVFNLFVIDGYSHSEISELLHISVGTSKWHLANAKELLKNMFQSLRKKKYEHATK